MERASSLPKKIQDLRSFTVQVRHIKTQETAGTGFVVSPDGLIATCSHVLVAAGVNPRLGRPIPSHWQLIRNSFFPSSEALIDDASAEIPVYFQWARHPEQRAQKTIVAGCFQDYDDDVVLLKLKADVLPEGVGVAMVDTAEDSVGYADMHPFRSLGYRRLDQYQGIPSWGNIVDLGGRPPNRILQADPLVLESNNIDSGMSGAAVLDVVRDKVVGIISETSDIRTGADRDTNFAVDYQVVLRLPPMLAADSDSVPIQGPTEQYQPPAAETSGVKPAALPPESAIPSGIDLDRAPAPLTEWVGRELLLQDLDQDWQAPERLTTALIGFGGEGKSSLARRWVDRLLQGDLPQPQGVFWWGFYERRNVDEFFEALLTYLVPQIDPGQLPSNSAKIQVINAVFKSQPYLFILDGLEVLQHQEGDEYGLLTSVDLKNWLRDFSAGGHHAFCLITSRVPMLDLIDFTTYTHREVARLNDAEGMYLLRNLGVQGDDPDLLWVVQQWDGYALVLSLLGSYLVEHHHGAVQQLPGDLAPMAEEPKYDRVSRVLRRYDEHLTTPAREFLEGFSAFRLPVPESALEQVFGLTNAAVSTNPQTPTVVDELVAYRIVRHSLQQHVYTIHPLIRSHYLQRLNATPDRAKVLHRQIAEYYLARAGETLESPTLDDLSPLIEAVHHFCQAEDCDKAEDIRWERIYQRDRSVLIHRLGAYDTDLALYQEFFPDGDTTREPQVSNPASKNVILNNVGFCLMHLGRLQEAPPFYERAVAGQISDKRWSSVSLTYQNLAELYTYLGNLTASTDAARSALMYARRVEEPRYEERSLARQGWAAHLTGQLDAASNAFRQAETIQKQRQPGTDYLYSFRGIQHADHLRRVGETGYARQMTEANRETCQRNSWLASLSRSHRVLGDLDAHARQQERARQHYDDALQIARSISVQNALIEALLARGRWSAHRGDVAAARSDLEEALNHAVSGGYRVYEADGRVGLAWMHLRAGNPTEARQEAERAQRMSVEMGYHWGQVDAQEVIDMLHS